MTKRSQTKRLYIGDVAVGGGAPVVVQSMTNTDTRDTAATCAQIERLAEAGCELVRVAVPDEEAALSLKKIKENAKLPLIADIHFDYRLALMALEQGVDGLRLNPGNIGGRSEVKKIATEAKARGVPIRVGVNAGSLSKNLLEKYGHPSPEALVESAQQEIKHLEDAGFEMIKVSVKSSDVLDTVAAYRLMAQETEYPLHLGVTETGTLISGTVKSTLGLGLLLLDGLGDTIRVSLTRDPVEEVRVAYEILRAVNLRHHGPEIISCPTCGRCEIDLFSLVEEVENRLSKVKSPIKVAVMGCVVNGPGEARSAQLGIAGGRGQGVLFKEGQMISKIPENKLADVLVNEVKRLLDAEKSSE
ncbi:MAG: flavodoxin-dependent (E)-4-hydroxy-3-methylbut-2-enyl-diphosphate synthase [Deltaproteobacteria bacterium]|nr:flavodoxin-dependent (E)-4-hydroxy-3-methylbut-2-enyl-diphosphate synthase [Deltaproteobacteria bacterium]